MNYRGCYIDTYTNTYNINISGRKIGFLTLEECCNYIDTYLEKKYQKITKINPYQ